MAKRFKKYLPIFLVVGVLALLVNYFCFYPMRVMPPDINPVVLSVLPNTNKSELTYRETFWLTPEQGQVFVDIIASSILIPDPFLGMSHRVVEQTKDYILYLNDFGENRVTFQMHYDGTVSISHDNYRKSTYCRVFYPSEEETLHQKIAAALEEMRQRDGLVNRSVSE